MAETETEQVQDTEITLGTGKLLGIFFGLVLICAFFFTMGYLLGRSSGSGRSDTVATVPGTSGTTAAKPTAADKTSNPGSASSSANSSPSRSSGTEASTAASQGSASSSSSTTAPADSSSSSGSEVKTGSGGSLMVQVAAVSKQEDADILVSALRKKQYPVFVASSPSDPLFHVQVGPFADPKDAEAMKSRLVVDGYNAIVKR